MEPTLTSSINKTNKTSVLVASGFKILEHAHDPPSIRIEWRSCRVRIDKPLVLLLGIVWVGMASATVFLTLAALGMFHLVKEPPPGEIALPVEIEWICLGVWLIIGWSTTIVIPYLFLGLFWTEWIDISNTRLSHGFSGFLISQPVVIPLREIREITIGHLGEDSFLTANVIYLSGDSAAVRFGYWLAPELKILVCEVIGDFALLNKLSLLVRFAGQ